MKKLALLSLIIVLASGICFAQTSGFTYQGKLADTGSPANGIFQFECKLFDAAAVGNQIGLTQTVVATVTNGVFTTRLDFGAAAFVAGQDRWLEIGVRVNGSVDPYTVLSPRQQVNSVPFAVRSLKATDADNATNADNATKLGGVSSSSFVQTLDTRLSDARTPTAGSTDYIQNRTSPQTSSDFNISGNGTVGGTMSASQLILPANGLAVGTDQLVASGGNIGIGTTTPTNARLVVVASVGGAVIGEGSPGGVGVVGNSTSGAGVTGGSSDGTGVIGNTASGIGVNGGSNSGPGVFGTSQSGVGVNGQSVSGTGVSGSSSSSLAFGVDGFNASGTGVRGTSNSGLGVLGTSSGPSGTGVLGTSSDGIGKGVVGTSAGIGTGVVGQSISGTGVVGNTASGTGVFGQSTSGTGVVGNTSSGVGVYASSSSGNLIEGWNSSLKFFFANNGTLNLPANGLVAGANQLVLSGGNVGIGTTSTPSERLHVVGNGLFTGNLTVSGTLNATLPSGSTNYIQNQTALAQGAGFNISGDGTATGTLSASLLRGTSTTGVGVFGTSESGWGVIATSNSNAGVLAISDSGMGVDARSTSNAGVSGNSQNGTGVTGFSSGGVGVVAQSTSGNLIEGWNSSGPKFFFKNDGTLNLPANGLVAGTNQLVLAGGNVGIGTTSANNRLTVDGRASFGGVASASGTEPLEVQGLGAGYSLYDRQGGASERWVLYSDRTAGAGTNTLRFWSGGDKAVITSSGNLGVGTTTPSFPLNVVGSAGSGPGQGVAEFASATNDTGVRIKNTALNGGTWTLFSSGGSTGLCQGCFAIYDASSGQARLAIDTSGNVSVPKLDSAGGTALCRNSSNKISTCSSSIRYKQNVNAFNQGLSLIKQLRPVSFNWRANNQADLGLVAEDVARVEPLLTTTNDKGEIEGVKYDRLSVIFVNAFKEQQLQLDRKDAEIKTLQSENVALNARLSKIERMMQEFKPAPARQPERPGLRRRSTIRHRPRFVSR